MSDWPYSCTPKCRLVGNEIRKLIKSIGNPFEIYMANLLAMYLLAMGGPLTLHTHPQYNGKFHIHSPTDPPPLVRVHQFRQILNRLRRGLLFVPCHPPSFTSRSVCFRFQFSFVFYLFIPQFTQCQTDSELDDTPPSIPLMMLIFAN